MMLSAKLTVLAAILSATTAMQVKEVKQTAEELAEEAMNDAQTNGATMEDAIQAYNDELAKAQKKDEPEGYSGPQKELNGLAGIVEMLSNMKQRVEDTGKEEQASFDKYACWCEATLKEKGFAINTAKDQIDAATTFNEKASGEIGSHSAEIEHIKKMIAENAAATKESEAVRSKEATEYAGTKSTNEENHKAISEAIDVLGAATKKEGKFLEVTTREAQLLSIGGEVRSMVDQGAFSSISNEDLEVVKQFTDKPSAMLAQTNPMSAMQVGQNPFGDFAPQSDRVQGIFQGMRDALEKTMDDNNKEEDAARKSYDEFQNIKKTEKETLTHQLNAQTADLADTKKALSDSQVLKDNTDAQMRADTDFFENTKADCEKKAKTWSKRVNARIQELDGMEKALDLLQTLNTHGGEAVKFLQVSSVSSTSAARAYGKLKSIATQFKSLEVARIAVQARAGGHFDQVIASIDAMIKTCRDEEADDIAKRDQCERDIQKTSNKIDALTHEIDKTDQKAQRLENKKSDLMDKIAAANDKIDQDNTTKKELIDIRNEEHAEFDAELKDNEHSLAVLKQATDSVSKFYNKKPEFIQVGEEPYGGLRSETTNIISMLDMLMEDVQQDITEGKADEAQAQEQHDGDVARLDKSIKAQQDLVVSLTEEKASTDARITSTGDHFEKKSDSLDSEHNNMDALHSDCNWIHDTFNDRREQRKSEMDGLEEAKAFLAGGGEDLPPTN